VEVWLGYDFVENKYIPKHRIQFGALSGFFQKELNNVECCVDFYHLENLERE